MYIEEVVGVALGSVVEAPVVVHARLPVRGVELIGLERGVAPVAREERAACRKSFEVDRPVCSSRGSSLMPLHASAARGLAYARALAPSRWPHPAPDRRQPVGSLTFGP